MPTILITGATSGLGEHLANRFLYAGWTVLAHGRHSDKLAALAHGAAQENLRLYQADLGSLDEVRSLADTVAQENPRLDVLVNNAGVGYGPLGEGRQISKDGYELRLAVNYLAPMLLATLLMPTLAASRPARIVNVGSTNQGPFDTTDVQLENHYTRESAYQRSKMALAAGTFDLGHEHQHSGIAVHCVHPATRMDTAMVRDSGVSPTTSIQQGADAVVQAVTNPSLSTRTGLFFDGTTETTAHADAYNPRFRAWLRSTTHHLLADRLSTSHLQEQPWN
ncbi:SDR family oxidoreductase [Streptomyces coacervatus]|uniref:SDR family oxidoreductase n=2 Tax=Streptomyces coacervatus TaxID=647381 RepID=A0ABP7HPR8_9ACTN